VYVYDMRNMEKKMSASQKQQTKIKESKVAALEVNKPGFLDVGKVLCHPKEKEFAGVCYDSQLLVWNILRQETSQRALHH